MSNGTPEYGKVIQIAVWVRLTSYTSDKSNTYIFHVEYILESDVLCTAPASEYTAV